MLDWLKVLGCVGALAAAAAVGCSKSEGEDGDDGACIVGAEGCPCTGGGTCDPGLSCRSGICVNTGPGDGGDDGGGDDGGGDDGGGDDGGGDDGGGSPDLPGGDDGDTGDGGSCAPSPPAGTCDPFAQDCGNCYKCNPWANDGGTTWNDDKCVPVDPNPRQIGEQCTATGGGTGGEDDCVAGAFCYDVSPTSGVGECVELCSGTETSPICNTPSTFCVISNDGSLPLCREQCNPLLQDCPAGRGCYPIQDSYVCNPDASGTGGAQGAPCEYVNACDPGLACLAVASLPGCTGSVGCCSAFCDLSAPSCPSPLVCSDFYPTPPTGLEDVGVCTG